MRIIVAREADVRPFTAERPTLLIAFTPAVIAPQSSSPVQLKRGDVHWLERGGSVRVRTADGSPAHLLAIALLDKKQPEGS